MATCGGFLCFAGESIPEFALCEAYSSGQARMHQPAMPARPAIALRPVAASKIKRRGEFMAL